MPKTRGGKPHSSTHLEGKKPTEIKAAVAGEKWAKEKVIEHYTPIIDELAVGEDIKQHLILKLLEELPNFLMGQA